MFYAAAIAFLILVGLPSPHLLGLLNAQTGSSFVGTSFNNGHIVVNIGPQSANILDPITKTVLGIMSWEVQAKVLDSWQTLSWDNTPTFTIDDYLASHQIMIRGTMGHSLQVSMYFEAKKHDALYTPLRMPVEITSLGNMQIFRLVWHVDKISASAIQFEQRVGDNRIPLTLPIITSGQRSPGGENSLVALSSDKNTVLFGLNWDAALPYYQSSSITGSAGASLIQPTVSSSISSSITSSDLGVTFGDFALAKGEKFFLPACPCPDGGGGGGPSDELFGNVYTNGGTSLNGIYGAKVNVGGYVVYTDRSGNYWVYPPAGTYTATVTAFGYNGKTTSVSIPANAYVRQDFPLTIVNTYTNPVPVNYELSNNAISGATLVYSHNTDSNSISTIGVGGELGAPKSTPSGSTTMIRMAGHDYSSTGTGYAYAYFELTNVYIPLSSPMFLAFNVNPYFVPLNVGHVSVDAHFTDGTNLRDVTDDRGRNIMDGESRRIHPALETFSTLPYWKPGGWNRATADLSELRYKTIDYLMVAYDNGQTGSGGYTSTIPNFQVYFDDIRFEMATFPVNLVNGGFEQGFRGWDSGGNKPPLFDYGTLAGNGKLQAYLGRNPSVEPVVYTAEDSVIAQAFRVPNDPSYRSPVLSFWGAAFTQESCLCGSVGDYVKVTLRDRTLLQDFPITVPNYYTKVTYDLTPLEGHVLWLIVQVHNDADGVETWAYFDEFNVLVNGASLWVTDWLNSQLTLDPSVFTPSSQSTGLLGLDFSAYSTDSSVNGGIQIGTDLYAFSHNLGVGQDQPIFTTSLLAWTNGGSSGTYYIRDATITVGVATISGSSNIGAAFFTSYGYYLSPSAGFKPLDPVDLAVNSIGVVLVPFAFVPGADIPVGIIGGGLAVFGFGYMLYKSAQQPTQPNPSTASLDFAFQGFNPGGVWQGGASAVTEPWFGTGGGTYKITITGTAGIYSDHCTQNSCWSQLYKTLSISYNLTIKI